jgi:hypothetical protein
MLVDVTELLAFFDEESAGSVGHASALVAIAGEDLGAALVARFLRETGAEVEILPDVCSQGTRRGCRLDRWIMVHRKRGSSVLYQTEIKNWSAHAIGGRRLARSASASQLARHKIERWKREWNGTGFVKPQVAKVLTKMRSPRRGADVAPLVCFWDAMHPSGAKDPWFTVSVAGSDFTQVSVFSMSSYLRTVSEPVVDLPLPSVDARREWLARLFPSARGA